VGPTTKGDNIEYLLDNVIFPRGITTGECAFWGDEFTYLGPGVKGSDAEMMIDKADGADFYDVSEAPGELPEGVEGVGGGVESFLGFLKRQAEW
jgi:hypothetical protein